MFCNCGSVLCCITGAQVRGMHALSSWLSWLYNMHTVAPEAWSGEFLDLVAKQLYVFRNRFRDAAWFTMKMAEAYTSEVGDLHLTNHDLCRLHADGTATAGV